ncbi:MAG: glycosyltransferase family 9 protein [Isosphaeraceae bacterium]
MTKSRAKPGPVQVGRYRYSKLRWRLLVRALDSVGAVATAIFRPFRPFRPVASPRRVLVVQLDHLGDAVLSTPLIAELRIAYPKAAIDVLASPSNHEVFEADPNVDRVWVAERTWFERRPDRWALATAVWSLGRSLRRMGYDLGIDVRGDVLTVMVLALAGVRRRVGWAMGGGAFLLTDVAEWIPGRHEVKSRLALLSRLGITPDPSPRVDVHVTDEDRIAVARRLAEAWPRRTPGTRRAELQIPVRAARGRTPENRDARHIVPAPAQVAEEADWLHADRFAPMPPLLAVHLGAGNAAKRWPARAWKVLVDRFIESGWRVVVVGGSDDLPLSSILVPHDRLRDWAGTLSVTETTALLERADLFIGADSGPAHLAASAGTLSVILFSGTNQHRQWRPWSRHSLTIRHRVPCQPCHQKVCPLAGHPCMSGLDPERVYRGALRWWSRTHRAESPHAPM